MNTLMVLYGDKSGVLGEWREEIVGWQFKRTHCPKLGITYEEMVLAQKALDLYSNRKAKQ